jgi:hypothetical protein
MIILTRKEAQQVLDTMQYARAFVISREKIKQPEGCDLYDEIIELLRARLSAPEPEPVMAEFKFQEYSPDNWGDSQVTNPEFVAEQKATNEALRNMVQQEPVAWAYRDSSSGNLFGFTSEYYDDEPAKNLVPLYTAPPQREWVGLTEQEHANIAVENGCASADWVFYGAAVERALKEKNT